MAEKLVTESPRYTILVVDDEESIRNLSVTFLSQLGHSCVTANDGVDALDKMKGSRIDAIITDVKMPNMDGMALISKVSEQYPELPIMVMTAFDEEFSEGISISAGAREFIKKPFSLDEFAVRLRKMIEDAETIRRLKSEKAADENVQELMNELETTLKKG